MDNESISWARPALRNALATYETEAAEEHIIPRCANALEDRIREIVGEA
jgi:hypothetical protein